MGVKAAGDTGQRPHRARRRPTSPIYRSPRRVEAVDLGVRFASRAVRTERCSVAALYLLVAPSDASTFDWHSLTAYHY